MRYVPHTMAVGLLAALAAASAWAEPPPVTIQYDRSLVSGNRWQYTYTVNNVAFGQPVNEFTVWFGYGSYANLASVTPNPPAASWNEVVAQPDPVFHDNGFYDALQLTPGIPLGGGVSGFAVQFDWLGTGLPGAQAFDIIDPTTFQPLYSGTTTPEPATAGLLAVLALLTVRRRR